MVYNATGATGDRAVIALPAPDWSLVGKAYRYKGTGAVTQVQVAPDKLKPQSVSEPVRFSANVTESFRSHD